MKKLLNGKYVEITAEEMAKKQAQAKKEETVRFSALSYEEIVSALIREKYQQDNVEAIINNYLLDSNNDGYKKDFDELQAYRIECKTKAREITS